MKKYLLGTTAFAAVSFVTSSAMAQSLDDRVRTLEESMLMGSPGSGFAVAVSGFIHGGFVISDIDAVPTTIPGTGERPSVGREYTERGEPDYRPRRPGWGYYNGTKGDGNFQGNAQNNLSEDEFFDSPLVRMGGSEVHFTATRRLDNGIEVGGRVELEGFTEDDQIDETYIWMEGGFGRLQVGAENGASYLMHYSAPWVSAVNGVDSPNYRYAAVTGARTSTQTLLSSDANKITYFTPRFSGFQFGISFTPNSSNRDGEQNSGAPSDSVEEVMRTDSDYHTLENIVSAGINFARRFGDVSLGASAGWESGTNNAVWRNSDSELVGFEKDPLNWHIGGEVSLSGFTFGGAYHRGEGFGSNASIRSALDCRYINTQGVEEGTLTCQDRSEDLELTTWAVGARYAVGPWSVGLGYLDSVAEGYPAPLRGSDGTWESLTQEARGDAETQVIEAAVSYEAVPGVTFTGDINFYEDSDGNGNDLESVGGGILMGISF
ncbi:MAG: porin [Hyphomicrobiales bacterium]|nr:porin [Hyphomicrobiales bacterium]MCY4049329.1 porin [Hyphomicrobiales bacterium]